MNVKLLAALLVVMASGFPGVVYWTAPVSGLASNASNWNTGVAPASGDDVILNASSVTNCTWNLNISDLGSLTMATGHNTSASNGWLWQQYDLGVVGNVLLQAGTLLSTKNVNVSGNWTEAAGFVTSTNSFNVTMKGLNGIYTQRGVFTQYLNNIVVLENSTVTSLTASIANNGVYVAAGKTLTVGTGKILYSRPPSANFQNLGTITGGYVVISTTGTRTVILGTINSLLTIQSASDAANTVLMGGNAVIGSALSLAGGAANNKEYVVGGGYNLTVTGLVTAGNNVSITQGTGIFNFSGGYNQNGNNTIISPTSGNIYFAGLNYTVGTFNSTSGSKIALSGNNFIARGLGVSNANFTIASGSWLTLWNNSYLNNVSVYLATFWLNGSNVKISSLVSEPANSANITTLGAFLNLTNSSASYIYDLNVSYNENLGGSPMPPYVENRTTLRKFNGTDWLAMASSIDITNNVAYIRNATDTGIIAPVVDVGIIYTVAPDLFTCVKVGKTGKELCVSSSNIYLKTGKLLIRVV